MFLQPGEHPGLFGTIELCHVGTVPRQRDPYFRLISPSNLAPWNEGEEWMRLVIGDYENNEELISMYPKFYSFFFF